MGIPFPSRVQTSLCMGGGVWPSAGVYVIMLGWSHTAFRWGMCHHAWTVHGIPLSVRRGGSQKGS